MKKILRVLLPAALLAATPLAAQDWSLGAGTGPFLFGDFAERTLTLATETGTQQSTTTLSADVRAGLSVDLERSFSERWAVRAEGTFTRAPLKLGSSGGNGIELDAGEVDVMTIALPLVFRINPRGALRFHLAAGPAWASYRFSGNDNSAGTASFDLGTRNEWGFTAGGGVAWWLSDRFAVEGRITDIVTTSPFERSDLITPEQEDDDFINVDIPETQNVHTTVGVRWRF